MHWSANKFATQFKCLAHALKWKKKSNRNYYFVVMVDWNFINHHSNDYRWYLSTQFICFEHLTQIFEFYIHLICTNDGPIFDIHKKKTNWKHFPVLANYLVLLLFCTKRERWTETGAQSARAFPNICFWAFLIIIYWIHSLVYRVKVFNWIQSHSTKERDIKIEREKAWNISVDTA